MKCDPTEKKAKCYATRGKEVNAFYLEHQGALH